MRWSLIDHFEHCKPGIEAIGVKVFPSSEFFFTDHFPGMPIVPGVLQIEMIAQTAGKCIAMANPKVLPVLGNVKGAKFYHNIGPEEICHIHIQVEKISSLWATAAGEIKIHGKKVSSANILFGLIDRSLVKSNDFDKVSQDWFAKQEAQT